MKSNLSLKRKTADIYELPKDVILGVPVLTVTGTDEIYIENYTSIIEYTNSLIRIRIKSGQIKVIGKNLHMDYYNNIDMKIKGRIDSIEFHY